LLDYALLRAIPIAALALSANVGASPRVDFTLHCGGCHLADGRGLPPEVPSLRGDPGRIAARPAGRAYLIRVPGAAQSPLDDAALAAVLNWVMSEFNAETLPARWKPFTASEIAKHRSRVLEDPAAARAELWQPYGE
jgi:mono/diheme cytochrome c family protein